ncbi:GDP-mannose 4,6-dehydratase, partial [Candidatus Roizmanbacteria bacterium]|nr:GDP-mannose 4,6-dehydratase [Candidatus Roizmanbacteria bacterium]
KSDRGIVNLMIKKALNDEPITIYGNGEFIRDYLYIDDVMRAFIKAGENIKKTKGNYYVIGTGVGHTILEMATTIKEEISKKIGKKVKIMFVPFPKDTSRIEYRNFVADTSRFMRDTGWSAKISLRRGIKKTIDYFLT